jgi:hypothetical protein
MSGALLERASGILGDPLSGLRRRIAIRRARQPRLAPASPAPADFWRAWERLEELEAREEREEAMAQIDDLKAALDRLVTANRQLVSVVGAIREHNGSLAAQLAAQPDPAAVQALIVEAAAAADEAERALAPPAPEGPSS